MFPSLGWDQAKSLSITGGRFVRRFAGDAGSCLAGVIFLVCLLFFCLYCWVYDINPEDLLPEAE